jgi:trimethylamine---corrinoid protein Co-methyltransferase
MSHDPYDTRNRIRITVLEQDDLERIHERSLKVLEETGVILNYPGAREVFRLHGACVDDSKGLVLIPRRLVEEALQAAPRQVKIFSQSDPQKDCCLELNGMSYTRTTTGLNWIVDYRGIRRRPVIEQDVINWTRIIHAMPYVHLAGSLNDQEEAAKSEEVRAMARMLHYTDKPFMYSTFSGEGMRWLWRLTEVTQSKVRQPRFLVLSSMNSPLVYGWGQCEGAMVAAELGIPVYLDSGAAAGATAPVTLAGAVVQLNAEMLAALTVLQLHRPGAAVVYGVHPMCMDMKTGMLSISTTEVGLMSAACVQIGRYYGLPTASNGITTDTCTPDPMATLEKWTNGYLPFMVGANLNGGVGSLATVGTVSLEQLIIDDDLYGNFFRHMRGIQVNEDTLAAEVIAAVGPGNSYLAEEHTLAHFRDEYYYSPLANRLNSPTWEASGSKDVVERSEARVQKILAAPAQDFLTDEQSREVKVILAKAEQALAELELHT